MSNYLSMQMVMNVTVKIYANVSVNVSVNFLFIFQPEFLLKIQLYCCPCCCQISLKKTTQCIVNLSSFHSCIIVHTFSSH
jgi:hypothetical protein